LERSVLEGFHFLLESLDYLSVSCIEILKDVDVREVKRVLALLAAVQNDPDFIRV
jgi:hypothetical protein